MAALSFLSTVVAVCLAFSLAQTATALQDTVPVTASATPCTNISETLAGVPDLSQTSTLFELCLPLINKTGELPSAVTFFAPNNTAWAKSNFTATVAAADTTLQALIDSTAICNIIAYNILLAPFTVKELNSSAASPSNHSGYPMASNPTASFPSALLTHNVTVQPKSKLQLWGDLTVKWNNATANGKVNITACDSYIHVVNNVILPTPLTEIPAYGSSLPATVGPQGNGAHALSLRDGLFALAAAAVLLMAL